MKAFVVVVCIIFLVDAVAKSLTASKGIPVTLSVKSQIIDIIADAIFVVIGIHLIFGE